MADGRCVVITGAESGIGAACAAAFGETGDKVAVLYLRDTDAAEQTAQAVRAKGGQAITVQCAIDDEASVDAAFTAVEKAYGTARVLVNSAGINMSGVHVRDMPLAKWQGLINTDLTGAFLVAKRFVTGRGDGKDPAAIVCISSVHAEVVRVGGADYCAAKGGLTNLVRTLAIEEAANGLRVNSIEPGMVLTPMNEKAMNDPAFRMSLEANIPMKRAAEPQEIAKLARWLASDEAGYITGARIVIDGGLSLLLGVGA